MVAQVDQASGLRAMAGVQAPAKTVQVIAVSSGKGGVGKTNIVANLAVTAAKSDWQVMIMDADLALGNLDVLLGLTPPFTLEDVLSRQRALEEIVVTGPRGIQILPATSGSEDLTALSHDQQLHLQSQFYGMHTLPDLLLIDCAAGISENVLYFALVAHEVLVVVTPEPTSLTDAYALIKVLTTRYRQKRFRILINMARNAREGREVFRKLSKVTDRFLTIALDYAGWVPLDENVPVAVCQQKAVVELFPKSPVGRAMTDLMEQVGRWRDENPIEGGLQLFGPSVMWASVQEGV